MYICSQLWWGNYWLTAQLAERIATLAEYIFHSAPFYSSLNLWLQLLRQLLRYSPVYRTHFGCQRWVMTEKEGGKTQVKRKHPQVNLTGALQMWHPVGASRGSAWRRWSWDWSWRGTWSWSWSCRRRWRLTSPRVWLARHRRVFGWVCYACVVISIKAAQLLSLQREQQQRLLQLFHMQRTPI